MTRGHSRAVNNTGLARGSRAGIRRRQFPDRLPARRPLFLAPAARYLQRRRPRPRDRSLPAQRRLTLPARERGRHTLKLPAGQAAARRRRPEQHDCSTSSSNASSMCRWRSRYTISPAGASPHSCRSPRTMAMTTPNGGTAKSLRSFRYLMWSPIDAVPNTAEIAAARTYPSIALHDLLNSARTSTSRRASTAAVSCSRRRGSCRYTASALTASMACGTADSATCARR